MLKKCISIENLSTSINKNTVVESVEDVRARSILETTTQKNNNRYKVGLLWKYDNFCLPNSLSMAKKRLECLKKKLTKAPHLAKKLNKQIEQYVIKGYVN